MSSGSSDSETISKWKFETISKSDKESICGCCYNELQYSQEEILKRKENNGSASEKEASKEDDAKLGNTINCACKNWNFYMNMNTESLC